MVMVEGGGLVRVFNNMDILVQFTSRLVASIMHTPLHPMHTTCTQTQADVRLRVGIEL